VVVTRARALSVLVLASLLVVLTGLGGMVSAASIPLGQWVIQQPGSQGYELRGVWMSDPLHGWAVGGQTRTIGAVFANGVVDYRDGGQAEQSSATLLHTQDGGRTWTAVNVSGLANTPGELYGLSGLTAGGQTYLVAAGVQTNGTSGAIVRYDPASGSWQAGNCACVYLTSVSLTDVAGAVYGWAVDYAGSAWFSGDGGQTWSSESLDASATLFGVTTQDVAGSVYGWAVSNEPKVTGAPSQAWRATNASSASATWLSSALSFVPYGVSFADPSHGWVVGGGGQIFATTDGGATWTSQASGTASDLFAVSFIPGTQTGWAVGAGGTILMTVDGGADWVPQPAPTAADLYGVYAFQAGGIDYAWAVGAGGVILAFDQPAALTVVPAQPSVYVGQSTTVSGSVSGTVYSAVYGTAYPEAAIDLSVPASEGSLNPASVTAALDGSYGGVTFTASQLPGTATISAVVRGTAVAGQASVQVLAAAGGGGGGGGTGAGGVGGGGTGGRATCGPITLPAGSSLTATGVTETPSGIAPDTRPASCVFTLSGPTPARPEPVGVGYDASVLGSLPPSRISLFRLRSNGMWTFLPSRVDPQAQTVTALVAGPATIVALADLQVFPDVPAGYWAKAAIDVAAGGGLVDGFPPPFEGLYQPTAPTTRAQAEKMVAIDAQLLPGLGGLLPAGAPTAFTDVPASAWFAPYVMAGLRASIVQGLPDSRFLPYDPVTREAFATWLARALRLKPGPFPGFRDAADVAPWARQAVAAVAAAGYMTGFPDGTFRPLAPLSRAEAAEVMARVIASQAPR
jgi:photosystem II stability/assembly factor-like uncharacterized protein